MYIQEWFKTIFLLILISLLRKLMFLVTLVDFASPPPASPNVLSQVTLMYEKVRVLK